MPFQRSFAAGEIAPSLYSGADVPRYQEGLATCRNFLVKRHGGVENRAGTPFVAEVKDSAARTYLLKFVFNAEETYLLEFGSQYIRFFQVGAQVVVSSVPAWSNVTTYDEGDVVSDGGVNYYSIADTNLNHDPPNASWWYPLTDDILEVPTPYESSDLPDIQYDQDGDILRLFHPDFPIMELKRWPDRWTLTEMSLVPTLAAPANLAATAGTAGALVYDYVVTAISEKDYEESLPSAADDCSCTEPTPEDPNTLTWDAVAGAVEYNVYVDRHQNGTYYFIGIAASNSFNDTGMTPDESLTPPVDPEVWDSSDDYPAAGCHYQQRLVVGGSENEPDVVGASKTGFPANFTVSSPIQDDDAIRFRIKGKRAGRVRHVVEAAGTLIIQTSEGNWRAQGDDNGNLLPDSPNLKNIDNFGSSTTPPVLVGRNLLYVQARGSLLRDLRFDLNANTFEGRDLTIFANHLVVGKHLERIDYAEIPDSIVWCVRDDGTLLGLTYLPEFDRWGWHRHDTGGSTAGVFEDVCCIPEVTPTPATGFDGEKEEDAVYVIVKRTIDGNVKRYIERMASRRVVDYRLDGNFLDSSISYIGINAGATTVTLSSAGGWTVEDEITVTASAASFSAGDVGNGITVWDTTNLVVTRILITAYDSTTVVRGTPVDTVPVPLRATATTAWSRAVDEISGLEHLEGETVTALANGVVHTGLTVASGALTLSMLADVIHVGIPITADFETLDLDAADDDSFRDKKKLIKNATLVVSRSRGVYAGGDFDNLQVHAVESGTLLGLDIFTGAEDSGGALLNANIECRISSKWRKSGRVCVRQTEPLPLGILGVIPNGELGG